MKRLYYSLKDYYLEKHSARVYRIAVDAGFTCPTRDGTKGRTGCLYCDGRGSGNGLYRQGLSVAEQVRKARDFLKKKFNAEKFLLYFQAFTGTYALPEKLKAVYDEGLSADEGDIIGFSVGTRPDCVDREKLSLIGGYAGRFEVWVEYGLQSMHDRTLAFLKRGHTSRDYLQALELTKPFPVKTLAHIILGLPHETPEDMRETARFIAREGRTDAVKIHSLYIPRDSELAVLYGKEPFPLMSMEEYVQTAADVLEMLPEDMVIGRLTGETKKEDLFAPGWVLQKQKVLRGIREELARRGSWQGKKYA